MVFIEICTRVNLAHPQDFFPTRPEWLRSLDLVQGVSCSYYSPFLGLHSPGDDLSPNFFFLAASPFFYTSFSPLLCVHVQVSLFRAGTCLFSPYPKWLGVVVKAEEHGEEHGPIRRRVLNCSIGSLLLGPLLHCARPFFQERSGMPRTKSSSAIFLGHLDFHCMSSAMPLLGSSLGP